MNCVKRQSVLSCFTVLAIAADARRTQHAEENSKSLKHKNKGLLQLLLAQGSTGGITRRFALGSSLALAAPMSAQAILEEKGDFRGNKNRPCTTNFGAPTVETCFEFGPLSDARKALKKCYGDSQCVATGEVSPERSAPPWVPDKGSSAEANMTRAWEFLVKAVEEQEGLQIVEKNDEDYYLHATADSVIPPGGTDDVEFKLYEPVVATFRAASRSTVYAPGQETPISNQKSHRDRLNQIKRRLGWEDQYAAGGQLPPKADVVPIFGIKLGLFGDSKPAPGMFDDEDDDDTPIMIR